MEEVKLVGPTFKGKAGEKIKIVAEFDHKCYACVHERREGAGYKRLCDQHTNRLEYDALLYDDTTDFIVTICDFGTPHLSYE